MARVLCVILFIFFMQLPASGQPEKLATKLPFSDFLINYLESSPNMVAAKQRMAQSLRTSQINRDNYQSELGAIPSVAHLSRVVETSPVTDIYNRATDVQAYYRQNLPTGTQVEVRGQKFIDKSNPLLQSLDKTYSVVLSQDLINNGFGSGQRKQAEIGRIGAEVAGLEYFRSTISACEEAYTLYTDAYILQERWGILKDQLADARKAFESSKELFNSRLITRIDYISSESDYIQTKNDVERAQQTLANGKNQLTVYVDRPAGNNFTLVSPDTFVKSIPKKPNSKTLAEEIAAKKVETSELEVARVKSVTGTNVDLSFEVGQREGRVNTGAGLSPFNEDYVNASISVAFPVINETNNANLNFAISNQNYAAIEQKRVADNQMAVVNNLFAMETLLVDQVLSSEKRLNLLNEKAKIAFNQMRAGKMEFENYLLHRNAYRSHQLNHLQLQKDLWLNRFAIKRELANTENNFCGGNRS